MKGYTHENSKGFREMRARWPARPYDAQPTRMPRQAKMGGTGSGNARPPATHAKYGVDPDVGPNRMPREAKMGGTGSGNARPPANKFGTEGVATKPNPGYGV